MTRIYIVVEGQTEETFVKEVLAEELSYRGVYLYPLLLGTPSHQGGRVNYQRVKRDVQKLLKQDRNVYCTTLIDLYGLGGGFPERRDGLEIQPLCRAERIEIAMKDEIARTLGESWRADIRFIPYIQQYEFEGLLFSDPAGLAQGIYMHHLLDQFQSIRGGFTTPEDINDGPETAPSKRILKIYPPYQKPLHGVLAALEMGLRTIRGQCPRFNAWIAKLEALGAGVA